MTSPPELDVGPWSLYGGLFKQFLNICLFDCSTVAESGKVGPL